MPPGTRSAPTVRFAISRPEQAEEALLKSYAEIERLKDKLQAESDYLKAEVKVTQAHESYWKESCHPKSAEPGGAGCADRLFGADFGETGTGKELIAQTITALARRGSHVMVKVNCGALPRHWSRANSLA